MMKQLLETSFWCGLVLLLLAGSLTMLTLECYPPEGEETVVPPEREETVVPPEGEETVVPPEGEETVVPPGGGGDCGPPGGDCGPPRLWTSARNSGTLFHLLIRRPAW